MISSFHEKQTVPFQNQEFCVGSHPDQKQLSNGDHTSRVIQFTLLAS